MTQKYHFVAAHASEYPLTVLCRVLGLARSGYAVTPRWAIAVQLIVKRRRT